MGSNARPWRGLAVCGGLAGVAVVVSSIWALPSAVAALFAGLMVRALFDTRCLEPGARAASGPLLRLAVVLLALRMEPAGVSLLGWPTLFAMGLLVFSTLGFGLALGRALRFDAGLSVVIAASAAICGASAAMSVASVLPASPDRPRHAAWAVAAAALFSTLAMLIFPLISRHFGFDARQTGLFLGGAIADVAQVAGAGYGLSPEAGDFAVTTKLMRVLFLAPVVFSTAFAFQGRAGNGAARPPLFIIAFFGLLVVSMLGLPWVETVRPPAQKVADICLAGSIAGIGITLPLRSLTKDGARPLLLSGATMLFVAIFAVTASYALCQ